MATVQLTERELTIHLGWWEKLAARRSHLTVPTRKITGVRVIDDGLHLPEVATAHRRAATRIKGLTATGTVVTGPDHRRIIFVACHKRSPRRALIVELINATVDAIIVTVDDAPGVARAICAAAGRARGG